MIKEKYYWGFAYRNEYDSTNILQRAVDIDNDNWYVIYDYTFNEQNHVIQHAKCINSDECDEWWSEYDEKGNMIHIQVNRDYEDWYEYNYSNTILEKTYNSKFTDTIYYTSHLIKATYD